MAATNSTMLPLGTPAPDFALADTDGNIVRKSDFENGRALLVMFVCNHCPYVIHVKGELAKLHRDYKEFGVAMVAISANDPDEYPEDSPQNMAQRAEEWGWDFPYLYDETQMVAQAYKAACTPDFYIFDGAGNLAYRGQLDASRPGGGVPATGSDVRHALEAILDNESPNLNQTPSIGCGIKWRRDNVPSYAG